MSKPVGVWVVAGTPGSQPYPCRCYGARACGMRCPCRGRPDIETMPTLCCARRAAETKERQDA